MLIMVSSKKSSGVGEDSLKGTLTFLVTFYYIIRMHCVLDMPVNMTFLQIRDISTEHLKCQLRYLLLPQLLLPNASLHSPISWQDYRMLFAVQSLSCVQLFCNPTVALQAPLSMGFLRQEYWSGLSFPSSGDLPDLVIQPKSPAWQADSLALSHLGSPKYQCWARK